MRALATTGETRSDPNIPTLRESGVDVVTANWRGVFAGPGLSAAQTTALTNLVTQIVKSNGWKQELETRKWTDVFLAGEDFKREITENISATEVVMKDLGLA